MQPVVSGGNSNKWVYLFSIQRALHVVPLPSRWLCGATRFTQFTGADLRQSSGLRKSKLGRNGRGRSFLGGGGTSAKSTERNSDYSLYLLVMPMKVRKRIWYTCLLPSQDTKVCLLNSSRVIWLKNAGIEWHLLR